jgi:hypothetical membrane protein
MSEFNREDAPAHFQIFKFSNCTTMRFLVILLLIGISLFANAQQNLPTIKASSDRVDIRVGDDYFSKGGWILEPAKDPDVFSIGSKWPYKAKKVSFITDIDSISFSVDPGNKYDFIVLKSNVPCHIQIQTRADPVFQKKQILTSLLIGLLMLIIVLVAIRNSINTKLFLSLGYLVAALFWIMTFASGYLHGNYNHFKNVISDLGAIGTKSEVFTSCFLVVIAVVNILFCIGFYRASKENRLSVIPAVLSFAMPFTMIWAAIFPLGNEFHSATGPLPFLVIISSILPYFLWKGNNLKGLRTVSLISFVLMMLILTRFIKPFGYHYEGLVQRFFYLGWTVWTVGVAYYLRRRLQFENLKI